MENINFTTDPQPMYNLTVDEAHTFFVGHGEWLVHNVCFNQVDYGSTDLSKMAQDYRVNAPEYRSRDVVVYEYVDIENNVQKRVFTSDPRLGASGTHAEKIGWETLKNEGIQPNQVKRIYSELEPCSKEPHFCSNFLSETFADEVEVSYSFEFGKGVGDRDSERLGSEAWKKAINLLAFQNRK